MQKSLLLLLFLAVAAIASAQEVTETDFATSAVTSGTILTEHDMAGFQQTSNALSSSYSKDQKIAIAGWTLFAVGVPFTAIGGYLIADGLRLIDKEKNDPGQAFAEGLGGSAILSYGIGFTSAGGAALVSGITCLGVSYKRMGGHADLTDSGIRERKPLVTYNLQSSRDGLGFSIRF